MADQSKLSSLISLAYYGESAEIYELLSQGAVDPNITDAEGMTALHAAVQQGHLDVVRVLIAAEASINRRNTAGLTPIFMLAGCPLDRQVAMIGELVEAGASLRAAARNGVTAEQLLFDVGGTELREWLAARH
ncbi:ankyrin repeat domain-containing protein [Williamsia sterculiae]|uniref:Ankyrin repeat-containing protein n=1 Tax=Williamsia sterculiae TaxID=1344003 RepID=A0A1N7GGR6_9NOCA|nr:ankyrin repeat domain-containing protein [Williamsia sterculiae]SIS11706.1 Ankyrin repeat-containing protein [Williamsia sterculiae]